MLVISLLDRVEKTICFSKIHSENEILDDGILRVYDLSSFKVLKAIRGLKNEVSSIACFKRPGSELRDAWIACGSNVQRVFIMLSFVLIVSRPFSLEWTPLP